MRTLLVVALVAVSLASGKFRMATASKEVEDRLIRWSETYQGPTFDLGPWIQTISWHPRAFVYHGFLSAEECDHLIKISSSRLSRSQVVGDTADEMVDAVRTSQSTSLGYSEDDVVRAVEDRIAAWTHLPLSHGEPIEVLRYRNGEKYDAHWDWFEDKYVDKNVGNRIATVLMYLSDVLEGAGGETGLPLAEPLAEEEPVGGVWSRDEFGIKIKVRPRKGDALLFWDAHPDGKDPDRRALHASLPTTKGQKWTATRWLPYNQDLVTMGDATAQQHL